MRDKRYRADHGVRLASYADTACAFYLRAHRIYARYLYTRYTRRTHSVIGFDVYVYASIHVNN